MMEIYTKNDLPKGVPNETYSYDVITCDEDGLLNIGFYDFAAQKWMFHTDTMVDYYEKGHEMNFVWIYKPKNLKV